MSPEEIYSRKPGLEFDFSCFPAAGVIVAVTYLSPAAGLSPDLRNLAGSAVAKL